jgi:hypothetical protein
LSVSIIEPAHAQATRIWVSGVGDDANPCSRTAPCKTFAGAISKTAANGLINCIDPGGFGAVTITNSITIDCRNVQAGILAASTNAINVNGAGIVVILRGLSIEGTGTGLIGINALQFGILQVEQCKIFGFQSGTAVGVRIVPSASAKVFVTDTVISENGGGVVLGPVAGPTAAVLQRVQLVNNQDGLRVNAAGGQFIFTSVEDSLAASNTTNGFTAVSSAGVAALLKLTRSASLGNGGSGVLADGAASVVIVGSSSVAGNGTGFNHINAGSLISYQDNSVSSNGTNGTPTGPISPL